MFYIKQCDCYKLRFSRNIDECAKLSAFESIAYINGTEIEASIKKWNQEKRQDKTKSWNPTLLSEFKDRKPLIDTFQYGRKIAVRGKI